MTPKDSTPIVSKDTNVFLRFMRFISKYFTMKLVAVVFIGLTFLLGVCFSQKDINQQIVVQKEISKGREYLMVLHRKSNIEFLYQGKPGDLSESTLIKEFKVKSGIPNEKPSPLPQLLGRSYWTIVKKYSSIDNPETAPYFLELDVPSGADWPYGPTPYNECNNTQCDWELPGYFGLHGINGDITKLSEENPGSSGCIRHFDQDITYLFNILDVEKGVRYYIEDI